jgi:hypothetical protein
MTPRWALPLCSLAAFVLGACQSREEQAVELVERIAEVFEQHGDGDCDKLANRLDTILKENPQALAALAESDGSKEAQKRSAKYQARIDKAFRKIVDKAAKCGAEPRVSDAIARIM